MLSFVTCYLAVFIITITKTNIYYDVYTFITPLRRTSGPIQITIVLGVLGPQETFYYLVAGLFERDRLHPTPPTD